MGALLAVMALHSGLREEGVVLILKLFTFDASMGYYQLVTIFHNLVCVLVLH
jgi:hypothetical protein